MKKHTLGLCAALLAMFAPCGISATNYVSLQELEGQGALPRQSVNVAPMSESAVTPVANVIDVNPAEAPAREVKKAKTKAVASTADIAGNYIMSFSSLTTSVGDGGKSVDIAPVDGDASAITITNFWDLGIVVNATVDIATGVISIPNQKIGTNATYGDFDLAVCTSAGKPDREAVITGKINADGTLQIDSWWGVFVMSGTNKDAFFGAFYNTTFEKSNGTITVTRYGAEPQTYGIIAKQVSKNVVTITNLMNYGTTVEVLLKRDKTAVIESQIARLDPANTNWYTRAITYTINEDGTASLTGYATTINIPESANARTLAWKDWSMFSGSGKYYAGVLTDTQINTTFDIEYPVLSVTDFEGEGTEASPYLIKTLDDLILLGDKVNSTTDFSYSNEAGTIQYAREFIGKYFRLESDIDMTGFRFDPIGSRYINFAGIFDGNGKKLTGLDIDTGAAGYAGLFGNLDTVAVVKNLTIENPNVVSEGYFAGAVAARSLGVIENCHVYKGTVSNMGLCAGGIVGTAAKVVNCSAQLTNVICQYGYCGGVAGEVANGSISDSYSINCSITAGGQTDQCPTGGVVGNAYISSVSNCYSTSTVHADKAANQNAGGVAGTVYKGSIENCFNTGYIFGYDTKCAIGGVVGYLMGTMTNCYNTGRPHCVSSRTVGGITGCVGYYNDAEGNPVQSKISNCYNAGVVTAECYMYDKDVEVRETFGSLATNAAPVIENVYFDAQMCDLTSVQYRSNTAELTSAAGPKGFPADAWTFTEGYYPRLKSFGDIEASRLSSAAIILSEYSSVSKVLSDATLNGFSDVFFGIFANNTISNKGYYSSIEDGKLVLGEEFGTDTLYIYSRSGSRFYELKISPIPFEGAGTVEAPFLLKNKEDMIALCNITNNAKQYFPETYFKITNDIDLEYDTRFTGICADAADAHNQFAGHIDGGGHTIHNMKFDCVAWSVTPDDDPDGLGTPNTSDCEAYKGVIGRLGTEGSLKNLNIAADCDLRFWATSGALVGYNYGLVENCRNYAGISAVSCWVGGIVGQNLANATIRNCFNAGDVMTSYMDAGGIAGSSNGTIENCMNVGNIHAIRFANFPSKVNQTLVGGISGGSNGGLFRNVVNAGNLYGVGKVGGIVGSFSSATSGDGLNSMYNAINYGSVFSDTPTAQGAISGVAGTTGTVADVYFDSQIISIPATGNESHENMIPVETSFLTSGTPITNFDTELWSFVAGEYPVLAQFADEPIVAAARKAIVSIPTGVTTADLSADAALAESFGWRLLQGKVFTIENKTLKVPASVDEVVTDTLVGENAQFIKLIKITRNPAVPLTGKGTEAEPYIINTPEEWNALADFISKCSRTFEGEYVKIAADLDFTDKEFKMLAGDGVTSFYGTLDGNNATVKGIKMSTATAYTGALGNIGETATVKDLTFEGELSATIANVGGVAGKVYGHLINVNSKMNVTSTKNAIAGLAALVGTGAVIENCKNLGTVTGSTYNVAGIAANCEVGAKFIDCANEGKVESTSQTTTVPTTYAYASGLVGIAYPSDFIRCYNAGEVVVDDTKVSGVAGLVGYANAAANQEPYHFTECYNTADLSANGLVAGLVCLTQSSGYANMIFTDCYNTGDIMSAQQTKAVSGGYTAGLAAQYTAGTEFNGCYNTGNIISFINVYAAGIATYYKGSATADRYAKFINCKNSGEINAKGNQGAGIVAYTQTYCHVENCFNTGDVNGGFGLGGVVACLSANAVIENCGNAGDITSTTNRSGGVVGYNTGVATIKNCFNVGDVATTCTNPGTSMTTSAPSGYAIGGIAGTSASAISNCYNAGMVYGASQVGGIVGQTSKGKTTLDYCYNAGPVLAEADTCGAIIGVNPEVNGKVWNESNSATHCYYLEDFVTSSHTPLAEAMTVKELAALELPTENWVNGDKYTFPMLVGFEKHPAAVVNAAAVVLNGGNTYDCVTYDFCVGTPEGAVWTSNCADLAITGNDAVFTKPYTGELEVTVTCEEFSNTITLVCDKASGVDGITAGKTVTKEVYYNVQGVEVPAPAPGVSAVYMVVRTFDDGTTETVKVIK
ncbi:MAG: hypothetical protein ACI30C_07860 [Muribaculaceae bacterium]